MLERKKKIKPTQPLKEQFHHEVLQPAIDNKSQHSEATCTKPYGHQHAHATLLCKCLSAGVVTVRVQAGG